MYKKALSHLMNLSLIFLIGLSPVQVINAAAFNCVKSGHDMSSQKMMSHMNMQHDMSRDMSHAMSGDKSGKMPDCCKQVKTCHLLHCASVTAAIMDSNPVVHVHYKVNKISIAHKLSLVEFYPTSLYRPPKA